MSASDFVGEFAASREGGGQCVCCGSVQSPERPGLATAQNCTTATRRGSSPVADERRTLSLSSPSAKRLASLLGDGIHSEGQFSANQVTIFMLEAILGMASEDDLAWLRSKLTPDTIDRPDRLFEIFLASLTGGDEFFGQESDAGAGESPGQTSSSMTTVGVGGDRAFPLCFYRNGVCHDVECTNSGGWKCVDLLGTVFERFTDKVDPCQCIRKPRFRELLLWLLVLALLVLLVPGPAEELATGLAFILRLRVVPLP